MNQKRTEKQCAFVFLKPSRVDVITVFVNIKQGQRQEIVDRFLALRDYVRVT